VVGGNASDTFPTGSAELYDVGLGFSAAWQPQITSALWQSSAGGVTVNGSGFGGISSGSSGNSQDSPANYPVVELMSLNSGQALFLQATNWSSDSVTCPPGPALPPGYLLATVLVNGIPSAGQIVKSPTLPATTVMAPMVAQDSVTVNFSGIPGLTYTVQRAPTLAGPWTTIATVSLGQSGLGRQLDPNPPAGNAFYRTIYQ
jgi:hypothetical protein